MFQETIKVIFFPVILILYTSVEKDSYSQPRQDKKLPVNILKIKEFYKVIL